MWTEQEVFCLWEYCDYSIGKSRDQSLEVHIALTAEDLSSEIPVTPAPGNPMSSSGLGYPCSHVHRQIEKQTHTHTSTET